MSHPASEYEFVPLSFQRREHTQMLARVRALRDDLESRRSIREFSDEAVPLDVLDECIRIAGRAPSGANRQPWTFVVVTDPETKRQIRIAAEAEEKELYEHRISEEWRAALEPLGTTWEKPFLETVPALVVLFRHAYDLEDGQRVGNYYTQESVGIALGFFLVALHQAGLATLTHTPSPMGFLADILERPQNERAYVLLPVGYPAEECRVPKLGRKPLDEIRVRR